MCLRCLVLTIACWNISMSKVWNKDVLLSVLALSWLHSSVIQFLVKVNQDRYVSFPFPFLYLSVLFLVFYLPLCLCTPPPPLCYLTFLSQYMCSLFLSHSYFPLVWHVPCLDLNLLCLEIQTSWRLFPKILSQCTCETQFLLCLQSAGLLNSVYFDSLGIPHLLINK